MKAKKNKPWQWWPGERVSHILASGSEDGTCRIWDSASRKSIKLIKTNSADVGSVCFSEMAQALFVGTGNKVAEYQLGVENVIITESSRQVWIGGEDINQISFDTQTAHLAVANDDGTIHVVSLDEFKVVAKLCQVHDNIVSSVQFRPKKQWNLVSVGLDSRVAMWNFRNAKCLGHKDVGLHVTEDEDRLPSATSSGIQMLNPPLAHSVSFTNDGNYVAVGLGDSTVAIYEYHGLKLVCRFTAHSACVCQVAFFDVFEWSNDSNSFALVSAGNDLDLAIWRLRPKEKMRTDRWHELCRCKLASKPNWIAVQHGTIFVADVSSEIKNYRYRYHQHEEGSGFASDEAVA